MKIPVDPQQISIDVDDPKYKYGDIVMFVEEKKIMISKIKNIIFTKEYNYNAETPEEYIKPNNWNYLICGYTVEEKNIIKQFN